MATAPATTTRRLPRFWRRTVVAARRANIFFLLEIVAAIAFLAMVVTTYLAFTTAPPDGQLLPSRQVSVLLIGTLIPAMAILVLWGRRRALRRAAGSTAQLHVRLVFFFSLVAAIPTLLVAGFAAILFQSGVDFWFSDNSRGLMENANQLAEAYYEQNQLEVANETIAMASDLRFYFERGTLTDEEFADFYRFQAQGRDLNESAILQEMPDGSLRTAAMFDLRKDNEPQDLDSDFIAPLRKGEQVVVEGNATRIEALAPIDRDSGIFLYNARNSEALSFNSWERAKSISSAYDILTSRARALQLRFNLALFFVSLGLVWLAVWFALRFADRQVKPLTDLVLAAREVGAGNFALRVEGRTGADEIGLLNRAFNRMTAQLEKQTADLVTANHELDERRAFIEAVVGSVTAGIISVDADRQILLMNSSANELLTEDGRSGTGLDLRDVAPQIAVMIEADLSQGVVSANKGGDLRTLAVKIGREGDGHVITFEDITSQLLNQRQAAWSDVARRIAHEIKNPLTPIQLATERLKRRYRKQIESDGELFDELTNTIIRQVGDLRKMVDEFSSFARLPKPVFRQEDALDLVKQALFLQEVAHPEINFGLSVAQEGPIHFQADRHQVGQALTNVLKNAVEAVEAKANVSEPDYRGRIAVLLEASDTMVRIVIEDNGVGLPKDSERILEPYVTTREKGTGLGLAIVNKIVEEHGGEMNLSPAEETGTRIVLRFARNPAPPSRERGE
ncbi:ATP-binding protein [Qipengyuania oceanensis]|uniref:histidine kinase n=1 Tax=Qipengyuania oceanensis TaxID=1463597 RepID=A0A844YF79_9SPHN|nr:ATP-binding protein [Qipengyuania oceanensis]MXO61718.1 HAMP domain-containing protein [Qipengyuania oceanensis]